MEKRHITGLIMTGGKNSRMKGQIKLFLSLDGGTFFDRIKSSMQGLDGIYLSVNQTGPYEDLGLPMVVDEIMEIGPLGGLLSGLHQIEADALLVVASDMPFVTKEIIGALIAAYEEEGKSVVVKTLKDDRIHPLLGIYKRDIVTVVEEKVKNEDYRLMGLLRSIDVKYLEIAEDALVASNINTPSDYDKLK